jgi:hypothetical protein
VGRWSDTTTGGSLGVTHVLDMDSNPTASPISISPFLIWLEMMEVAMRPEEQNLGDRFRSDAAFHKGKGRDSPVDALNGDRLGDTSSEGARARDVGGGGQVDGTCIVKVSLTTLYSGREGPTDADVTDEGRVDAHPGDDSLEGPRNRQNLILAPAPPRPPSPPPLSRSAPICH